MKYFLPLLLLVLFALFLGCDGDDDSDSSPEQPQDDDNDSAGSGTDDDDDNNDDDNDDDDDASPPEYPETCASGPALSFQLNSTPRVVPFPNDLYTVTDPLSPTGRRVRIDGDTARPLGDLAAKPWLGFLTDAYNELTGFSPLADFYLPVGVEPGETGLPAPDDPAVTDGVFLMLDDPESPLDGELTPLAAVWRAPDLHLTPWFPLREKTHYLLVATRALQPKSAGCYRASSSMRDLWTAWATDDETGDGARYSPILKRLAEKGIPPENILALADFTTGWFTRDLTQALAVLNEMAAADPPAFADWEIVPDTDPRLFATAQATFEVPIFKPDGGAWQLDAEGRPLVDHYETVPAYFTLPAADANPDGQPYPILIFEHGLFNDKHEMRPPFTTEIAAQGFATVGIDALCHGDRLPPGTGEIGQILCFYDIFHPLAWRDNFRESVANLMWLRLALNSLAEVDLDENGIPDFDVERVYSLGASFGSILNGTLGSVDPDFEAVALAAAGAKLTSIVREGEAAEYFDLIETIEQLLLPGEPITDFLQLVLFGMLQAILDPADSANYLNHLVKDPLPSMNGFIPQVMQQGSADDETIGGPSGGWLCRSAGWPQIEPVVWDAGVGQVAAPYSGSGYYQFDTEEHTLIFDDDELGIAAREQVIHYLRTHLDDGVGEIIDPLAQ
ncbi:MAG: hypothetical protein GX444_03375 [Myxococcales bacterium]|nr:hypothetical protein [Myxococcales bacterium]